MFEQAVTFFLYAETPLHAGSGTGLGIVDLPIQRERVTGYPIVQASGLKGCLRDMVANHSQSCNNPNCPFAPHANWDDKVKIVFGPETSAASDYAGAASFSDAKILLFPVRSLVGVFAWVTSTHALSRFQRDVKAAGQTLSWSWDASTSESSAFVGSKSCVVTGNRIVLEEFAFNAEFRNEVTQIGDWIAQKALPQSPEYKCWRESLPKRLVILPEDAFRDFTQLSTEVVTRIRINDESKTVASGALWSEELLPADSLLYAQAFASKPRVSSAPNDLSTAKQVLDFLKHCINNKRLQIGGDTTIGRGLVSVCFLC
ncbi:MAG: type III-B CRISPR module RAMP protein Cmr4 [Armatimonadetes bacterium]|nr:type III-B CRISPR module RAMP protein Cmr4 [Armatimonadota bacterium]MDW8121929.1 type III-B CRISPR module RAMP protein Cmr4 [Armatimonadota bacterium]